MRVLAEIRWCETHGRRAQIGGCTGQRWKGCVVVDAQVTRTDDDKCGYCGGSGQAGADSFGSGHPCPNCGREDE